MKRLNKLLAECAEAWQLPLQVVIVIFWLPVFGCALVVLARLNKDVYRFMLQDDGPIEWAQVLCWLVVGAAGLGVAFRRFKAGYELQALLYVALVLAALFVTGEEIAWGQRILGLKTPDSLDVINKQHEITLHNIGEVLDVFNPAMMLGSGLCAIAYFLNKKLRLERYWEHADYLLVPPIFLAPAFLVMFGYRLARYTLWPTSGFTVTKYSEWAELCMTFGLAMFVWLNYRRLAREAKLTRAVSLDSNLPQTEAIESS